MDSEKLPFVSTERLIAMMFAYQNEDSASFRREFPEFSEAGKARMAKGDTPLEAALAVFVDFADAIYTRTNTGGDDGR